MDKINFGEIRVGSKARQYIKETLDNNWLTMGPRVKDFEEKWEQLFGYKYNVAMANGTCGVTAACMALYDYGARPGDYVVCPALSFCATWNAIRFAGFIPYPVDIDLETLQINTNALPNKDIGNIAGVCAVNLMGRTCNLDILQRYAKDLSAPLIVDNCEAYGATLDNKYSLEYGDFEVTSHFIAHLVPISEFSTVSCKTLRNDVILRSIRSHGRSPDSDYFQHDRFGGNFKPTDLHACIGLEAIDNFHTHFQQRKQNLQYMIDNLSEQTLERVVIVKEDCRRINAPHALSITFLSKDRNRFTHLTNSLDNNKIMWKRNFGAITQHKAFTQWIPLPQYPIAEHVGRYGLHIGCHEYLSQDDLDRIVTTINGAICES